MRIECQGHYEKTVKYAESIGDETLNKCIERLKQWEANSNGRCEIELYYDSSPYSFGFAEVAKRWDKRNCRRVALSWQAGSILCRNDWRTVSRVEHTYLNCIVPYTVLSQKVQR